MRNSSKHFIEDILRDYPHLESYILERSGIKSARYLSNQTKLVSAISIAEDRRLMQLARNKYAIDACLERSDDLTKKVISLLYFKNNCNLTLEGVGIKFNISKSSIGRIKNHFIEMLGNELGIGNDLYYEHKINW